MFTGQLSYNEIKRNLFLRTSKVVIDDSLNNQWCRQDFQLTGSEYHFYPQNLKNPMETWATVVCFSKIDGFFQTCRTLPDDSTVFLCQK